MRRLLSLFAFCCSLAHALDFRDVETIPFAESVRFVAGRGWLRGYPDGGFRPEGVVTRAELAAVAARLGSERSSVTLDCFSDVARTAWYAPAIC